MEHSVTRCFGTSVVMLLLMLAMVSLTSAQQLPTNASGIIEQWGYVSAANWPFQLLWPPVSLAPELVFERYFCFVCIVLFRTHIFLNIGSLRWVV
jgi:hypothetical protein